MHAERSRPSNDPTLPDWIITCSQILIFLIAALPLRIIFRAEKRLPSNLELLRSGSLVVANHQSLVDPFFITMSLPFRTYFRILPMRFPTAENRFSNLFYNNPFFPILKLLGCFSIGTTSENRMRVIFYIRELLQRGNTVVLFPEGQMIDEVMVKNLKRGVDFFVKDACNVMFVRIKGFHTAHNVAISKRSITFGDVFEPPPQMTTSEMRTYLNTL